MKRILMGLGAAAALFAAPVAANAHTAYATADLNLRACGSVQCAPITVIPRGAPVNVIAGSGGGWSYVTYAGVTGYASGAYLATGYAQAQPPVVYPRQSRVIYQPAPPVVIGYPTFPAPTYGYHQKPWWDNQHGAWYDGSRWFYNGVWFGTPSFSFGFSFSG